MTFRTAVEDARATRQKVVAQTAFDDVVSAAVEGVVARQTEDSFFSLQHSRCSKRL
jgi:hypothetical protein